MPVANARAPSGASSTAAMPATMSTVLTSERFEQLRAGEHLEGGGERGQQVGDARADQPDEDQAAATPPVGERDGDQRHQHAGPGDGEGDPQRLVGPVEGAGHRVAVLGEQRTREVGDQRHRGERAEAARLLGRERHRRDDGQRLERGRSLGAGGGGGEPGGGVGERAACTRATPGCAGTR